MRREMDALVQTWVRLGCQSERVQLGRLPGVRLPALGIAAAVGGVGNVGEVSGLAAIAEH